MKQLLLLLAALLFSLTGFTQGLPELLYYKFDGTGTSVSNFASSPPTGTTTATLTGNQTQGPTGQFGGALIGIGGGSAANFLNTGWATNLGTTDWTISLWLGGSVPSATTNYFFGDNTAGSFRLFTGGVAGTGTYLRGGGLQDVIIPGPLFTNPVVLTFVYDATAGEVRAYVDGVLTVTTPQTGPNINGTAFKVGAYGTGNNTTGNIDEFRVYNRALSALEISTTWNQPLPLLLGPNNIGVTSINAPVSPIVPGMNAVDVTIFNFGVDTLTNASIDWTVDGVTQPTYSWTGSLFPGMTDGPINLGMANFPAGLINITAWTSNPNGLPDTQPSNDTAMVNILVCQSLAGTYTVGGATADYPTVSLAVDALLSCGVSAPVTMNINPGTYNENMEFDAAIPGASAVNTVTFNGGDATTTELVWNGAGGIATVLLWKTDYVTVKNLTLENTATTDAWGVHFRDTASYNLIDSCIFQLVSGVAGDVEGVMSSSSFTSSFTEGLNSYYNTISNNRFEGGDKGVHLEGSGLLPYTSNGNVIHNNVFVNPNTYGIYLDNMDTITISNNTQLTTVSQFGDGIYIFDIQNFVITGNNINAQDWPIYIADGNFDYQVSNPSLIANNMFSSGTDQAGRFDDFENVNLFHNTFYCGALTGTYFNDLDSVTMLNNIFYAAQSDAIEFADATNTIPGLVFDYNLLFSAGGGTLVDDGINLFPDLISWQLNNPALNVNSIEGNPDFYGPTDLHIAGTLPNDAGTPIVGITVDIDGDPRSVTTPDIGADEFTPLATDLGTTAFVMPISSGCGLSDSSMVTIDVRNFGLDTAFVFDISYRVGGVTTTESINDTLPPGVTKTYTFSSTVDLSAVGVYSFDGWPSLVGDTNGNNDTLAGYQVEHLSAISVFPYIATFDNPSGQIPPGWIQETTDGPQDWTLDFGGTSSTGTGPPVDHTFGTATAYYLYVEDSGQEHDSVTIRTPCFDVSALLAPEFSFWYHSNNANGPGAASENEMHIDLIYNGTIIYDIIPPIIHKDQNWNEVKINLQNYIGVIAVRFRVNNNNGTFTHDIAIDDIGITELLPNDGGVFAIEGLEDNCGLSASETADFYIRNYGVDTLFGVDVTFSVDGVQGPVTSLPDTLAPGDTLVATISGINLSTANTTYNVCAYTTNITGDTNVGNDTTCVDVTHRNAISSFPYIETFDNPGGSLPTDWVNDPNDSGSDWIFDSGGTPTGGTGPTFDHTFGNATGFYAYVEDNFGASTPQDDSVILITPCFDVSATNGTKFSFWYHSNNSQGIGGTNENQLHIDLYENGNLILDYIPPIIHKDNNWNFIELDMSTITGIYAFGFRVDADNGSGTHDIAIDDIGVKEILPQDGGISDLFSPQSDCGLGLDTMQLGLQNFGTDTIFSVDYNYQVNGGTVVSATYNDTLISGAAVILNVGPVDFSTPGTYNIVAWTSNLAGDTDPTNDTLNVTIESIPTVTSFPYFEDFESGSGGWSADNTNNGSWELGAPTDFTINSAASGVNAWVTDLDNNHLDNDDSWVTSPCLDFSNMIQPVIEIAVWWEVFNNNGGANLQASIGGGAWFNIGNAGDPINWYNSNAIGSAPGGFTQGWTGSGTTLGSNGWVNAEHDLDSTGGQSDVRLRVHFASGTINDDGFAFDDIFIYDKPNNDLGVTTFISPSAGGCSDDSTLLFVQIINFGIMPQTGFPVTVNYTGAASGTVTTTFNDTIQGGDTTTFLVGYVNTNVGGTFNYVGYTGLANDTTNFNDTTYLSSNVTVTSTPPIAADVSVCQTDSAQFTLVATAANALDTTIVWFDSLTGGTQLMIGDTFMTPFLSTNTTYYAQAGTGTGASGSLTSFPNFAGGNGQSGNMFDVTALAGDITIDSMNVHIGATTVETVEVYYTTLPGGYAANSGTAANWTLLGTQVVTGQGAGNPTSVDGLPPLTIPAGQTYGLYVTLSTGTDIDYTNGTIGDFDDNGDIRIDYGFGVAYPFGGTFNVRVWNGTIHYSSGCPSPRIPVQAIILPPAPVNIGPDAITCAGFVVDASDPNLVSYLWNTGETTPSIVVDTSGSYYVEVMNIDGCVGSDTINLNILPSPSVDLGPDSLISCGNVVLDAGNAGSSFIWNVAGQFQQTLDVTSSGWYSVEADLNGCTDTDSIFVEILTTPTVDLGADIPACADVTLDAGNAGATFLWSTGATSQTIVVPAPVAGPDSVSVTVTNADGCTAVDEIIISVGVPPVVDLGADTTNCDSVMLDAGIAGATYLWNTGATSQTITATTPGPYSVTVTDQFGCSNSDDINVALELSPNADFTANQPNWGFTVDFTNLSTPGALYIWNFGDGSPLDSGTVNPSHVYGFAGAYTVTLTVENDCGTDVHTFELGSIGLEDELFGQSIQVFPNPTGGLFYLNSAELRAEKLTIEVFDAKGSVIQRLEQNNVFGLNQEMDLSTQPVGVYLVKISDGDRTAVKRVVRE